ncbi:MAG: ABC transporter substrate-binding protein [Lachnospiraceae bacterium]|nr:ABC transporter substrate-binding protein [Lachnospiraceae bacterium]
MKRKLLSIVLCLTLSAMALAGCGSAPSGQAAAPAASEAAGGAGDTAATAAPDSTKVSTTTNVPTSGAEKSDTIMKIATPQSSETLDPVNGYDYWYMLRYGVCETLMKFNEDMTPSPWLVEEGYDVSEDKLTWNFTIKDNVTFSNGTPLTAEKVKASMERAISDSATAGNFFKLKEIKADGQKLSITTEDPVPIMPYLLADPVFVIYDTENISDIKEKGPIGTGPFVFSAFDPVSHDTSVVRNENYWDGDVKIGGIDFQIIADTVTLSMSMQNGELDAAYSLDVADVASFANNPDYAVLTSPSGRTTFGFMNQADGKILNDEKLRQAVIRALDRPTYCSALLYSQFIPGKTPLTSSLPYGYDELNDINAYDLEGAKKLLDEAGYADKDGDGFREDPSGKALMIPITVYGSRVEIPLLGQAMQASLKEVGINAEINNLDQSTAWNMLTTGEYDILLMSISMASSGDPENGLKSYFKTYDADNPNYNLSGYSSAEVDKLFEELNVTFDIDKRIQIIKDIEQKLMDDSACIYLCYPIMNFVTKSNVTGVTSHTSDFYWVSKDTGFTTAAE